MICLIMFYDENHAPVRWEPLARSGCVVRVVNRRPVLLPEALTVHPRNRSRIVC